MQTFSVSYPVFLCHLADHTEDDNKVETGLEELKRMFGELQCNEEGSVLPQPLISYMKLQEASRKLLKQCL